MTAIVDLQAAMSRHDLARGVKFFEQNHRGNTCTPDEAVQLALDLDSSLPEWKVEKIREETEPLTKEAFARLMLKYGVARFGMGVFYIDEMFTSINTNTTITTDTRVSGGRGRLSVRRVTEETKTTTTVKRTVKKRVTKKK
jgi:hypothetical protein